MDQAVYDGQNNEDELQMKSWDSTSVNIIADIIDIPEPDISFDAIMSIEVFEHLPDPPNAMREFNRLLRINGTLILTVPVTSLTHFAPEHFYNGFGKYYFQKYLTDFCFNISELSFNGNYFEYLAQEIRRVKNIATRYSKMSRFRILIFRGFSIVMIRILNFFSMNDSGSEELLSHGIHIVAQKIKNDPDINV